MSNTQKPKGEGPGRTCHSAQRLATITRHTTSAANVSRPNKRPKLIAMFGASLNPVTLAHVAIVQALLDEKWNAHVRENLCGAGNSLCDPEAPDNDAPLFDEVWVLPVYSHPDVEKYKHIQHINNRTPEQDELLDIYRKKKELHDSFNDRVRLCQVAFADHPRVKVKTYERDLWEFFDTFEPERFDQSPRSHGEKYAGTLHLIRWILGAESYEGDSTFKAHQAAGTEFAWFMGQDTWASYVKGHWMGKFELQTRVHLVNAPRDGRKCGPLVPVPGTKPPIALDHLDVIPTSSTEARKCAQEHDGQALRKQVPEMVADYIEKHNLYSAARTHEA
eukprot:CAMPEP_0195521832 /NCGR_PEP_ID=MMETSP0794_2-20130614/19451_1 /TAXON_ID=515487 /ORGANISM="Stephanopyxis turris, Strain CCMP 815" /LENGTH=332 /DNA_ID=CAMNT_0040651455 /DNA_START=185 /DNA_END=1179 /DNA_ORIENTATION=-